MCGALALGKCLIGTARADEKLACLDKQQAESCGSRSYDKGNCEPRVLVMTVARRNAEELGEAFF